MVYISLGRPECDEEKVLYMLWGHNLQEDRIWTKRKSIRGKGGKREIYGHWAQNDKTAYELHCDNWIETDILIRMAPAYQCCIANYCHGWARCQLKWPCWCMSWSNNAIDKAAIHFCVHSHEFLKNSRCVGIENDHLNGNIILKLTEMINR